MDAQNYQQIVGVCDSLAAATQDPVLTGLASGLHRTLESAHKPTMALVSFNMNHAERFGMVRDYAKADIPSDIAEAFKGEPACVIFDYAARPGRLGTAANDAVVYGLPGEALKSCRIAVCDEIKGRDKWIELAGEIDVCCLVVNATMAMNQVERTWLQQCGLPLFRGSEPLVALTGMQLLNSEEDAQAVKDAVGGALRRLMVSTSQVCDSPADAMNVMAASLAGDGVTERRNHRAAFNYLTAAGDRAKAITENAAVSADAIDAAVSQLEGQRKSLEMSAQLASDSILFNELNRLRTMATETIRDYGRQMAQRIKDEVETYPLDQLGTVDQAVNSRAAQEWNEFIQNISATTDAELAKVSEKLASQMEADAGELIGRLDEQAQRTLYSAMAFGSSGASGGPLAAGVVVRAPMEYSGVNVFEITNSLKRETRGMMLVSIPLLFVNPLFAVGSLVVSKVIGKYRTESELKHARKDIAKQIDMMCNENAERMVGYVADSFNRQIEEGSQKIRAAYADLLARLEEELGRMKFEQGQRSAAKDFLEDQSKNVIPSLLAQM